ncbi:XdhC family protein [Consotaella sp. CSK11QG-6]
MIVQPLGSLPALDPVGLALRWMKDGRRSALATVIETWGSAPRPAGSHLVIDADGNFEGSVSGGCVEGAVVAEALDVIETHEPRMLEFGVADETAWQVGLSCGGRIKVYVEPLAAGDEAAFRDLDRERSARRAAVLVTALDGRGRRLVGEADAAGDPLSDAVGQALRLGKPGLVEVQEGAVFINPYLPPPRLVAIGAVHISQALAPMAALAGFDLDIIDPRAAFASEERFPGAVVHSEWPDEVLKRRPLDAYTAVAALTHDPKIDDQPLIAALQAGCFYVGALGSRKTHARRVERLLAAGVPEHRLACIDAPIGADIGAANPAEIAVAILASVIEAFRRRKMLAERRGEMAPA